MHLQCVSLATHVYHQLDDLLEVRFAEWGFARIYISTLEGSEEDLAGSCVEAVRAHHSDWHMQPFQHLHCTYGAVVSGS